MRCPYCWGTSGTYEAGTALCAECGGQWFPPHGPDYTAPRTVSLMTLRMTATERLAQSKWYAHEAWRKAKKKRRRAKK